MEHILKYEALIHQNTIDQMKKVSKELNGMDIGKRVSDDSFSNSLETTKRDITETDILTYSDYMKEPFKDNQNRKPWKDRKKKK